MPESSSQSTTRKRKRVVPTVGRALPLESINPLSHPPNLLKQFAVAGLSENEQLPSLKIPDFPHRPLPRSRQPEQGQDGENEADEAEDEVGGEEGKVGSDSEGAKLRKRSLAADSRRERRAREIERNIGVVVAIARRSLAAGDIKRAKAAFATLLRSRIYGQKLDLRYDGYWAIGAEILMREEEEYDTSAQPADSTLEKMKSKRWGSTKNMARLKTYFEYLARLYPYFRSHKLTTNALDFSCMLFSCETYNIYVEHMLALEKLEAENEDEDDGGSDHRSRMDVDDGSEGSQSRSPSPAMPGKQEKRNKLRLVALEGMKETASRMDEMMSTPPYSTDFEMLRLRGMVALYMADLVLPLQPRTDAQLEAYKEMRNKQRAKASKMFSKILSRGGELEDWIRNIIDSDQDDDDDEDEEEEDSEEDDEKDDDGDDKADDEENHDDGGYDDEQNDGDEDDDDWGDVILPMFSSLPIRPS
jgi:hypothetical protein